MEIPIEELEEAVKRVVNHADTPLFMGQIIVDIYGIPKYRDVPASKIRQAVCNLLEKGILKEEVRYSCKPKD
jgi:hypothetical protein